MGSIRNQHRIKNAYPLLHPDFCRGGSLRPPAVTAESALQQERQEGFTPQEDCVSDVVLCRCGNPSTGSAGPPPFDKGGLG